MILDSIDGHAIEKLLKRDLEDERADRGKWLAREDFLAALRVVVEIPANEKNSSGSDLVYYFAVC